MKLFHVYLITCFPTGRHYIGVTSRGVERRWREHLWSARKPTMAISRAINKYGPDRFTCETICSAKTWDDICAAERLLIVQWNTLAPHGYNVAEGGEGPFGVKRSPESVERSAAKHRGKPCHHNTLAAARARKGVSKSAEMRAKLSASKMGEARSEETKRKISEYWAARRARGDFKTDRPYAHR